MRLAIRKQEILVPGFKFSGVAAGIKERGGLDLALVFSEVPAVAAGAFTLSRTAAPPVLVGRKVLRQGRLQALVVNSGNANAGTGRRGMIAVERTRRQAAAALGIPRALVLAASTGKIGVVLPDLGRGIAAATRSLSERGFWRAASAILTTDAFPKVGWRRLDLGGRQATLAVMAKGAGMIAPRMATLLVFFFTDAAVSPKAARALIERAALPVLNAISVDGDTSTNDTALLLANGKAGNRPIAPRSALFPTLFAAMRELAEEVAEAVVVDGEGASKLVEVLVTGAGGRAAAENVARAIGESLLVKTAVFGGDPNWGRILAAVGKARGAFDPESMSIRVAGVTLFRRGEPVGERAERKARLRMKARRVRIEVDMGRGGGRRDGGSARLLGSDLTPAYVRFNSAYST